MVLSTISALDLIMTILMRFHELRNIKHIKNMNHNSSKNLSIHTKNMQKMNQILLYGIWRNLMHDSLKNTATKNNLIIIYICWKKEKTLMQFIFWRNYIQMNMEEILYHDDIAYPQILPQPR